MEHAFPKSATSSVGLGFLVLIDFPVRPPSLIARGGRGHGRFAHLGAYRRAWLPGLSGT